MSKPYTLDTFMFDVSCAVAKVTPAQRAFVDALVAGMKAAHDAKLDPQKISLTAIAAINEALTDFADHAGKIRGAMLLELELELELEQRKGK